MHLKAVPNMMGRETRRIVMIISIHCSDCRPGLVIITIVNIIIFDTVLIIILSPDMGRGTEMVWCQGGGGKAGWGGEAGKSPGNVIIIILIIS